jgi:hypothetical protein
MSLGPMSHFDPERTFGVDGLLPHSTIQSRSTVALKVDGTHG